MCQNMGTKCTHNTSFLITVLFILCDHCSFYLITFLIVVTFVSSPVYNTGGHFEVYIDPTVPFFATKHIPLIIFSLFVALFLYLPPLLLLMVYPTIPCTGRSVTELNQRGGME